ncbi:MAG TPA: DMT family transporter [Candidatus Dependentiae bacterium]|nr:DMT family transporter [Candidatus Dependentiae bacterium]HRQ63056.1 DMT family transporter [Candidatus Dependentiae bacterium]
MIEILVLHMFFGASNPIGKFLLQFTSPAFLSGIRMGIAGLILLGYQYLNPRAHFRFQKNHIWLYLQLTVIGVYLKYILRYWSLSYLEPGKFSFLLNVSPFVAALFSFIFFKEKLTQKKWIGLSIGFIGLVPMLITTSLTERSLGEFVFISWPELAALGAVVAHVYGMIIVRILVRTHEYASGMINGISMFGAGILGLGTAFAIEDCYISNPLSFFTGLMVLVIISNVICKNLYTNLVKHYSVTFLSFTDFLAPCFAVFYSWLWFGEKITWNFYASGIIVLVGLYIFYQDELTHIHAG